MDNLIDGGKYPVRETVYGDDGWPEPRFKTSCHVACAPGDFRPGGKCERNGCYSIAALSEKKSHAEQAKVKALPRYKIRFNKGLSRVSHFLQGEKGVRIFMKSGRVFDHFYPVAK